MSEAFVEDPVRILRVARFAARYAPLGFRVADETLALMRKMVADGEANALVAERVWTETEKALGEPCPDVFISVLRDCGALKVVYPEIDALFGVPQPEKWHPEIDTGVHQLMALREAVKAGRRRGGAFRGADARSRQGGRRPPTSCRRIPATKTRAWRWSSSCARACACLTTCASWRSSPRVTTRTCIARSSCAPTPCSRRSKAATRCAGPNASRISCWPARRMRAAARGSRTASYPQREYLRARRATPRPPWC